MSQVTEQVINDIKARELKGLETYGQSMDRDDMTQDQWIMEAYHEALDFAIYLKKLIIIRNGNIEITKGIFTYEFRRTRVGFS